MSAFLDLLHSGRVLLMDGAMGTELLRRRVSRRRPLPYANVSHGEVVARIHRAYVAAGAQLLLTNTFAANPTTLSSRPRGAGEPLCQAAVYLARTAAPGGFVVGDIGPMGAAGMHDFPDRAAVAQTVSWLHGVDGLLFETCSDRSVFSVLGAAKRLRVPILVSFACARDDAGNIATRAGDAPEALARAAEKAGVAALGVNCGIDMDVGAVAEVVRRYSTTTRLPLFARPNAGSPLQRGGRLSYPGTPRKMAARLPELLQAGAVMIGGCCGTTPAHIVAFRQVIDGWNQRRG
jgi:5-methyltetrahydrofolate--homocysteine methyltransferase